MKNPHLLAGLLLLAILSACTTEKYQLKQKTDNNGYTPLHDACTSRNTQSARILILHGAVINATDEDGDTPLIVSCQKGDTATVELLLQNRADAGIVNTAGTSALHEACNTGESN